MSVYHYLRLAILSGDLDTIKKEWHTLDADFIRGDDGFYLLHIAAVNANFDIITFLLQNGTTPNCTNRNQLFSPFTFAWPFDIPQYIRYHRLLLRYGGNPYSKSGASMNAFDIYRFDPESSYHLESYLVVELVCGEADSLFLDIWREVKTFLYKNAI